MEETSGSKAIVTTDKIIKFNTFSTLVNKWNGHKLREFDRLVDPDKQLDVLYHKGTDLAPAEILYTHGLWETKQKVYEHFSEETVRYTGEDKVIIPFINRDSKQKLLDQDLLIIHIGLVLIKITGLTRSQAGGQVILNLVDTRYNNDIKRAIIGTMEVDMAQNSGVIYMAPQIQMTVTDFSKHFQLIIKTRVYEDFTEGQNLAITKILTGRLSNNTNNNFKLKIDRVMQYLGSQGIKAIEGKTFTAKDLAGKEWNITLPATQPLVPSRTSFWEHSNKSVGIRLYDYKTEGITEPESDDEHSNPMLLIMEGNLDPLQLLFTHYPDYDWSQDFTEILHPDDCHLLISIKYSGQYPKIFTNPFASECQRSVVGSTNITGIDGSTNIIGIDSSPSTFAMLSTHTLMEEDEYDLPYPQQSSQLPPPKWDYEIPILMNEDTGSSSISNFHRIPEHHASNIPRPNFGGSQHTQIPTAGQQQGRQRGRNFPYEYINNLPRANVNDGSMLILSGTPPQL
ncbi:hypothetical protein K1719_019098 [Acacia pycnantha]|nr:hypothetical protein K1719_019098 [Acacia pycnantha]